MANTKKKGSGSRTNGNKTGSSSSRTKGKGAAGNALKTENGKQDKIAKEIRIIIAIGIAIMIFLSNIGLCGRAGKAMRAVTLGVFGSVGFAIPFIILIVSFIVIFDLATKKSWAKVIAAAILVIFTSVLFHLFTFGEDPGKLSEFYAIGNSGELSGGFIGAAIGQLFCKISGITGAIIIAAIIWIIALVVITEQALIAGEMNDEKRAAREEKLRQKKDLREERYKEKQLEREERERIRLEERERIRAEEKERIREEEKERIRQEEIERLRKEENRKLRREEHKRMAQEKRAKLRDEAFENMDLEEDGGYTDSSGIDTTGFFGGGYDGPREYQSSQGVDFSSGNVTDGRGGSIQDVHEVTSDIEEYDFEPSDTSYEETQSSLTGMSDMGVAPVIPGSESDSDNSFEFRPKERMEVSEQAMKTGERKPFSTGVSSRVQTQNATGAATTAGAATRAASGVTSGSGAKASGTATPTQRKSRGRYKIPPISILKDSKGSGSQVGGGELMDTGMKLKQVLANFGVNVEVTNVSHGPSVTRFELQPEMGTKVSRITNLADDIKLNMAASDIRIEAPVPGKAVVGIEIPNKKREPVGLKELLMSKQLREHKSKLAFPVGKDIAGNVIVADIAKMPHMLVAGTTGSGKSVFTNSILMSILFRANPDEVRFIIIDPKVVEFQVYNGMPNLIGEVITDPGQAASALNTATAIMHERYKTFANMRVKDIASYNAKVERGDFPDGEQHAKMPQILIIIDELADLMMTAAKDVEKSISRLAQLARAAGIHMIIATQRPSVDVITGVIKANIPSRVALTVASGTDSRTIIDMNGAEKLLGYGDMLFYPADYIKPLRIQGAFVSDEEIFETVNFIKTHSDIQADDMDFKKQLEENAIDKKEDSAKDTRFYEGAILAIVEEKASVNRLKDLRMSEKTARRLMEQLENAGIVSSSSGTSNKGRTVLLTKEEFFAQYPDALDTLREDREFLDAFPKIRMAIMDDEDYYG